MDFYNISKDIKYSLYKTAIRKKDAFVIPENFLNHQDVRCAIDI